MKKKSFKRITAIALSICCILTAIPILAIAQTYDEWKDEVRWNGDFEAGYEGMDVYGWKMVPFTNLLTLNTDSSLAYYATNHTLKTAVEEDGNKVAQLSRNGGGYAAMASQVIAVTGEQGYEISLDYKTIEVTATAETNTQFSGINLVVQQLDGEGNETTELKKWTIGDSLGYGQTVSNEWSTLTQEMIMESDTKSIIVYIAIRGQWNARAKVLIDNVEVQQCDENDVLNGDFECTQDKGIDGWSLVSCDYQGVPDANNYNNNYTICKVQGTDSNYMLMTPASAEGKTYGYALAQSSYIKVQTGQDYVVSYRYMTSDNVQGSSHPSKMIVLYYGSEKNLLETYATVEMGRSVTEWKTDTYQYSVPENAAYMTINFYTGSISGNGKQKNYIDKVNVFVDNGTQIFNGNGEIVLSDESVSGWSLTNLGNGIDTTHSTNWTQYYKVSQDATNGVDGSGAIKMTKSGNYGYAALTSSKVSITPGKAYDLSYMYKMTDIGGTGKAYAFCPYVIQYDEEGNKISTAIKLGVNWATTATAVTEWTQFSGSFTAAENASYCVLYIGSGGASGTASFTGWFDDVSLSEQPAKPVWSSETTDITGIKPRTDGAIYTGNYDMITVNAGEGHGDAYKLYVKREDGAQGVVTYFSEPMEIISNKEYTTIYDLKIEGVSDSSKINGAAYMVRYIKADGSYVMEDEKFATVLNGYPKTTDGMWKSYEHHFTTPSDAVKLQIGLCIGVSTQNTNKDMAYYYDNIVLEQTEVYEKGVNFPLFEGGDIDDVEGVDVRDLVHYKGLKAEKIEESFNEHADMNKNSKYDNDDQTLLMWKLIGKY